MISVIVPCYKCMDTLRRCVSSVARQSYDNLEIILVEDGSPDDTGKLCDILAETDARIKVVHQKNRGLVGAWKRGLLETTGEFISFVDSDDWIDSDAFEKMMEKVKEYNAEMIVCGIALCYSDGKEIYYGNSIGEGFYSKKDIEEKIFPCYFHMNKMRSRPMVVSRCSKLIKRDLLMKNYDYYKEQITFGEDDLSMFLTILDCKSLYCYGNYYPYHYYRSNTSMIGAYDEQGYEKCFSLKNALREVAVKKNYPYMEQIDIHFMENSFLALKKNMHRNNKESFTKQVLGVKNIVETGAMQKVIKECTPVFKDYRIEERIFVELLVHKYYSLCVLLVKFVSKIKIGKE